jgi:hypothetical protein
MAYYMVIAVGIVFVCGLAGTLMRSGTRPLD